MLSCLGFLLKVGIPAGDAVRGAIKASSLGTLAGTVALVFEVVIPATSVIVVSINACHKERRVSSSMSHVPMIIAAITFVANCFQFLQFVKRNKVHATHRTGSHTLFDIGALTLMKGSCTTIVQHQKGRRCRIDTLLREESDRVKFRITSRRESRWQKRTWRKARSTSRFSFCVVTYLHTPNTALFVNKDKVSFVHIQRCLSIFSQLHFLVTALANVFVVLCTNYANEVL